MSNPTSPVKIRENREGRAFEGDVSTPGWTIVYPSMTRPVFGVEDGAIERMREKTDQPMRAPHRELRVAVEGDDELHPQETFGVADMERSSSSACRHGGGD